MTNNRQHRTNPVTLLLKYQNDKASLTARERDKLWLHLHDYVARCEKRHFAGNADRDRFTGVRTDRILMLYTMLDTFRSPVFTQHPYINHKGQQRYARACSVASPRKHPNLVLTEYRRAFSLLEVFIQFKRLGVAYDKDVHHLYAVEVRLYTEVAKRFRACRDTQQVYDTWLHENPRATPYKRDQFYKTLTKYAHLQGVMFPLSYNETTMRGVKV